MRKRLINIERNFIHSPQNPFSLFIGARDIDRFFIAQPLVFSERENAATVVDPVLRMSEDDCVSLMDALWVAGVRPSKRIIEPQNTEHLSGEIEWLRGVADHLMKRK